jgi:hypothetical protein
VIDPEPRCWNSKSLPALKGSYSFFEENEFKKKNKRKIAKKNKKKYRLSAPRQH